MIDFFKTHDKTNKRDPILAALPATDPMLAALSVSDPILVVLPV